VLMAVGLIFTLVSSGPLVINSESASQYTPIYLDM
jgi:hypothetical protein